jgi:hypothetical protein
MPVIVTIIALVAVGGTLTLIVLSGRLRAEMDDLVRSFDHAQRALLPLVAIVRADRDRLADRLSRISEPGSGEPGDRR